ncbi:MAG: integrin [Proteobacteria bacterium]|nr:integrin [Pseudomonadota bacterium]
MSLTMFCVACGGGGSGAAPVSAAPPPAPPPPPPPPAAPLTVTVDAGIKQLNFSWIELPGATHYRLLENPDGHSGFTQVGADIPAGTLSVTVEISVHMFDFVGALFIIEGCDANSCTSSTEVTVTNDMLSTIGYFKSSNIDEGDAFGAAIALSSDGKTLAVGAGGESSIAAGINGDQGDNSAGGSGAVYVFRHNGTNWSQQAYLKASNSAFGDGFGNNISLSADGNTLAVGAASEASNATGINGAQDDNSAEGAGAVYVFRFDGADWSQQAYIKASNAEQDDQFGGSVVLSAVGDTLAVGARKEDSNATGINGDQANNTAEKAGAVYVFRFDGTNWSQQAYVKASNTESSDFSGVTGGDLIALSADGNMLAIGAMGEDSSATGIGGNQNDNSAENAGAVYVYRFNGTDWFQQAYIKASNAEPGDEFGERVAVNSDGNTLAVATRREASNATGINGNQADNSLQGAGAVYVFRFDGADWFQEVYIKASNIKIGFADEFGSSMALSTDGTTLAVGARNEGSGAAGVGGDQNDLCCSLAGAAYVFRFDGTNWAQTAYVKASNPDGQDQYGGAIALNADGTTLAVGSPFEQGLDPGIGGNQSDNSANGFVSGAGAVYVY